MRSTFSVRDRRVDVVPPVTVAEAAVLLGISSLAVYWLIHTDELPTIRYNSAIRIHGGGLATYLHVHRDRAGMNFEYSPNAHRRPLSIERPMLKLVSDNT